MKQRLFSSRRPGGSFFASSFHRLSFPFPAATLSIPTTKRNNLPHTIGSSRFGGHCTASGGCSGVVVDSKSIFHDDVAASSAAGRLSSSPTIPFLVPILAFLAARDVLRCALYSYKTEGSILFKMQVDRYFAGVSLSTSTIP